MAQKRGAKKARKPAARRASQRPERQQDPRLIAARAVAQDGVALPPDTWVLGVSPVRMKDGRLLMWHPPQPIAFNLIEAKRYRDRGVKRRRAILAKLKAKSGSGSYAPENSRATIDCISDLQVAVWFAFTAIESLANHAIDMLPAGTAITRKGKHIAKPQLARALGIDEKLKRVMPLMEGGASIAGTQAWTRYLHLKGLRDELLHVKERGMKSKPDDPSAYDRLILGDSDSCVEDAVGVVEGAWPGFLPDHVRKRLGLGR